MELVEDEFDEGDDDAPGAGVARYLLYIEYIGTRLHGMQLQGAGLRTVAGCVEAALLKLVKSPTKLYISSRTDAGVHSIAGTAHINLNTARPGKEPRALPAESVASALNHLLAAARNTDVSIARCLRVHPRFHARHHAKARTYYYRIHTGFHPPSIFEQDRMWHCKLKHPQQLDVPRMQAACEVLSGTHDFKHFRGAACKAPITVRTLELSIEPCASWPPFKPAGESEHPPLVVRAHSKSFLYHMVRLLVGTLKAVGVGELEVADLAKVFAGELPCPKMAPATGLVLADVHYDAADLHYDPAAHDAWRGTPLRTKAQHAAAAAAAAAGVYYPEPKRARVDGELPAGGLLVEHQSPLGEMDS